jgi:hypothetical protein
LVHQNQTLLCFWGCHQESERTNHKVR